MDTRRTVPVLARMTTLSVVTWLSVGLVVVALIVVHVAIGKQLLYIGSGSGPRGV